MVELSKAEFIESKEYFRKELITQYYGKKDYNTIKRFMSIGIKLCVIISLIFLFAVCIVDSYRKKHIHPSRKSFFNHSLVLYKDLSKIIFPILASSLSWGIGYSMRSMIMGHLGSDAIAAESVTAVILELTTCFCNGLSSGASIMIGRLLGQNRLEEAKNYGVKFCKVSVLCGIANIIILLVIGPVASTFFILTDDARNYLIQMMFVLAAYLFAYSLNTIITCGIFPAGGDTIYDAQSVIISKWCFSLPLASLGTFVFQ